MNETITIPTVIFPLTLMACLWVFAMWMVFSFLRTECKKSFHQEYLTNLDLLFPNGAGTATWKKLLVAVPMVLLAPFTLMIFALVALVVLAVRK